MESATSCARAKSTAATLRLKVGDTDIELAEATQVLQQQSAEIASLKAALDMLQARHSLLPASPCPILPSLLVPARTCLRFAERAC